MNGMGCDFNMDAFNGDDVISLGQILQKSERALRAELEKAFLSHKPSAGMAVEEGLREFLRNHLPNSIGITSGIAMDVTGARSKQLDIILYDALHTPLFLSCNGVDIVPVEGVLGVIEVKAHFRKRDIEGCVANCISVKRLQRKTYRSNFIRDGVDFQLPEMRIPKIIYSVFARESEKFYSEDFNTQMVSLPMDERVDCICYLDRGMSLNVGVPFDDNVGANNLKAVSRIQPFQISCLGDAEGEPLTVWFSLLSTHLMSESVPPIDLTKYVEPELQRETTTTNSATINQIRARIAKEQENGV